MYPNEDHKDSLERVIDQIGLENTIDQISIICSEKADHIRSTYVDSISLADLWESKAKKVENLRAKLTS
mgnify:FL=1